MTKEQRKEEIIKLIKEYESITNEVIDLDKLIKQTSDMVESKYD